MRHSYVVQFEYFDAGIPVEHVVIGECEHDGGCHFHCADDAIREAAVLSHAAASDLAFDARGGFHIEGWTTTVDH